MAEACLLCDPARAEAELGRVTVWDDGTWRLSMMRGGYTRGFSFLEPIRHVPHIEDLDGDEASTFGATIAMVSQALKAAAQAERVYVYVFGDGVPHLHVHLAPHRTGDALNTSLIRGELEEEHLPSGVTRLVSRDFPRLPEAEINATIDHARELLAR